MWLIDYVIGYEVNEGIISDDNVSMKLRSARYEIKRTKGKF